VEENELQMVLYKERRKADVHVCL